MVWHDGGTAGFAAYMAYVPEARVGIVVLANSGHGVDDLALGLIDKLVMRQKRGAVGADLANRVASCPRIILRPSS